MVLRRISQGSRLVLRYLKLAFLLGVIVLSLILSPSAHASPVTVLITPSSQAVPQGTSATYTVSLSGALATAYRLSLSGLYGASAALGSNPVSTPPGGGAGAGSTPLTISTTNLPGLYCPGTYSFTVSARNSTDGTAPWPQPPGYPNPDAGSGSATITVVQVGPPLSVNVASDKAAYTVGSKVTITIMANRPAEGRLTISPPSGAPAIFDYQLVYGGYSISKSFTANTIGHWTMTFQADDFCSGYSTAQTAFDVTPDTYEVSITLNGVPAQYSSQLQVDGQPQGTVSGGEIKKVSFKIDTSHSLAVDQYVPGDTGVRYYCAQNTASVTSAGSLTFAYQTQYQFTVNTDPNAVTQVTGGGWFSAGSSAQTSQVPQTIAGAAGTQYSFKGWEVDGILQSGSSVTVIMDKPHTAIAKYTTQYQLVVDSPYGDPQGSGFYDSGSTAQFSVTSPTGFLIQQVFVKWEGDFTGDSPQGSVAMNSPKVIHATWRTDYTQLYIAVAAIAAVAVVAAFLLLRRRKGTAPVTKPIPPESGEVPSGELQPEGSGEGAGEMAGDTAKCGSCGADVPVGQTFCHNCGAKMG
jgi:hypothetical protein